LTDRGVGGQNGAFLFFLYGVVSEKLLFSFFLQLVMFLQVYLGIDGTLQLGADLAEFGEDFGHLEHYLGQTFRSQHHNGYKQYDQ